MKHIIEDEELMLYLEGRLNKEEVLSLKKRLRENGELDLLYHLRLSQVACIEAFEEENSIDEEFSKKNTIVVPLNSKEESKSKILALNPQRMAAAKLDGYLCDIECEEYILLSLGYEVTKKTLLDEAYKNKWLKEKGMPLYHIGRLLEKNHLSVNRKYDADINDAILLLSNYKVIAVVNDAKLGGSEVCADQCAANPNHAVVLLDISMDKKTVTLFDPQTGNSTDTYEMDSFVNAWRDSQNFLVIANKQECFEYDPQPIKVDDVELSPELVELGEAIAENAHEVWARKRKDEGWSWGYQRNDETKENPDMVPYSDLPEEEKDYDRDMAMKTLKLVQKIGFKIIKDE